MSAIFERGRLATGEPGPHTGEHVEVLARMANAVIERIVSSADPSSGAEPEVYDQDHDEWVMVLEGSATLEADGSAGVEVLDLSRGDWVLLPAHCRHRILATGPGTLWLAVHVHMVGEP